MAGVRQADGQALATALAAGAVNVTLDLTSHTEMAESFNVIAETKQGRDDNVVMLGAHLDSVEEGPGINDNGTGSATILEVAVQLAKSHIRHDNTVRFAWWGAEELGLIGSTAYVDELATQEGELDRIATYLNYDMVGSPNYIIGVYDADQSTYPAPVDVPEGSEATEDVLTTGSTRSVSRGSTPSSPDAPTTRRSSSTASRRPVCSPEPTTSRPTRRSPSSVAPRGSRTTRTTTRPATTCRT